MRVPFAVLFVSTMTACARDADQAPPPELPGPDSASEAQPDSEPRTSDSVGLPRLDSNRPDNIHHWLILGVDGLDPRVVHDMWSRGRMRNLHRLCEEGVCTKSASAWDSSPVIWTTVATGMVPEKHGIDRFVTETPAGRVPIGAADRRTATLWEASSDAGYLTAQLGWWATWPADEIHGVNMSARAAKARSLEDRVSPAAVQALFDDQRPQALEGQHERFVECGSMASNDAWVSYWTPKVVAEGYDLTMAYLRCVDVVSHRYWGTWDTASFPDQDPEELAAHAHILPDNYEAADIALGRILDVMPADTNLIVMSDHGFEAVKRFNITMRVHTDQLLAALGWAELDEDAELIPERSTVRVHNTAPSWFRQQLRFQVQGRDAGGTLPPEDLDAAIASLQQQVDAITYTSGRYAFRLREPNAKETVAGADAILQVLKKDPTQELVIEGETVAELLGPITRNTGNHHPSAPNGFFLAWGPDIDSTFAAPTVRVQDVAPTVAYGMGLPVASDLDGVVIAELFTADFRRDHALERVASWGGREQSPAVATAADDSMIEELQALGYIN
jgi:predicted AlkP superfamily phosphohydrolase/phosphomutase